MKAIKWDGRITWARSCYRKAYPQMINYFAARYSWGQGCDPRRAEDWATLAGYLAQCQYRAEEPEWDTVFKWPSGNTGTPRGLVDIYHDGWALLEDLGVHETEWA